MARKTGTTPPQQPELDPDEQRLRYAEAVAEFDKRFMAADATVVLTHLEYELQGVDRLQSALRAVACLSRTDRSTDGPDLPWLMRDDLANLVETLAEQLKGHTDRAEQLVASNRRKLQ